MWWGAGYAVAQDRLFELELFRRATTGRLADIAGRDAYPTTRSCASDFYTPAELERQFAALPAAFRSRFDAYRDGINAWIDHVQSSPMTARRVRRCRHHRPGPVDRARLGRHRRLPGAHDPLNSDPEGLELANLRGLQLSGPKAFDRVVPLRTPGALTTIPAREGSFPSQPGRTRAQERAAFRRSVAFARGLPFPTGAPADPTALRARSPAARLLAARRVLHVRGARRAGDGTRCSTTARSSGSRPPSGSWSSSCTRPGSTRAASPPRERR